MSEAVYCLCAITSGICAALLIRTYRQTRLGLLLWTSLCFVGFTLNNVLLVVDRLVFPDIDMTMYRTSVALVASLFLLFGLVWEAKR